MASLQETFAQRQNESAAQVNDVYDKQYDAQTAGLKSTYERSMSDAQTAAKAIAPQYQLQANTLAGQYEKARRNANLNAMTSGLASGTGQQQQNALRNQYLTNYGALRGQEAGAVTEANQNMVKLTDDYNAALAKARAETEAKRNQSLIENYNNNQNRMDTQAAAMAAYGNFDMYRQLYGDAQADQMRNVWIAQNPDAAFRSGMISKEDYKKLTNKNAVIGGKYRTIYQ